MSKETLNMFVNTYKQKRANNPELITFLLEAAKQLIVNQAIQKQ